MGEVDKHQAEHATRVKSLESPLTEVGRACNDEKVVSEIDEIVGRLRFIVRNLEETTGISNPLTLSPQLHNWADYSDGIDTNAPERAGLLTADAAAQVDFWCGSTPGGKWEPLSGQEYRMDHHRVNIMKREAFPQVRWAG